MDEPTSSVDAHNELVIYENIFEHFKDRTVISSIHRLHLLGKFDLVIVMDQGKIVQSGTFKDLKSQEGLFQKLWDKYQESAKEDS
jgi:ABC-type multidrug transport system fused ATPase/permease subunit